MTQHFCRKPVAWILCAALGFTTMSTAHAVADDDARRAILDLRETVRQIQAAQMQLMTEINALKERNRQLTGRVEELTNSMSVEKRSTRELFSSLDERVGAFEPQVVVIHGETHQVDPREKKAYEDASSLLQDGRFKEALTSFRSFVKDWPQSPYRPDALYWLGSSAFAAEQYKTAISTQNQLLREYPKSVLAPDAMLLVASSQAASGSVNAAKATLRKVIKQYPKTSSAETAQKRLDEIQRASAKKSK